MTETDIYQLLIASSDITGTVGTDPRGVVRVYNGPLPERCGAPPAVSFYFVSDTPTNTLEGYNRTGFARYSFNAWGSTMEEAAQLLEYIIDALESTQCPMLTKIPLHEPEYGVYRYAVDFSIDY